MGQRMDHYLERRFLSVGCSHAQLHFLFIFHIITSSPVVPEEGKFCEQALPAVTGAGPRAGLLKDSGPVILFTLGKTQRTWWVNRSLAKGPNAHIQRMPVSNSKPQFAKSFHLIYTILTTTLWGRGTEITIPARLQLLERQVTRSRSHNRWAALLINWHRALSRSLWSRTEAGSEVWPEVQKPQI